VTWALCSHLPSHVARPSRISAVHIRCASGCTGQRDYETNGECRDWNYRLSNTAEAVGTAIGVTLIIIIVAIVLGVIGCIVCIWFMCCKQTTVIVNQTVSPKQMGYSAAAMPCCVVACLRLLLPIVHSTFDSDLIFFWSGWR